MIGTPDSLAGSTFELEQDLIELWLNSEQYHHDEIWKSLIQRHLDWILVIPWAWLDFKDEQMRIRWTILERVDELMFWWERAKMIHEFSQDFFEIVTNIDDLTIWEFKKLVSIKYDVLEWMATKDLDSYEFRRSYEWFAIVKQIHLCFKEFQVDTASALKFFRQEMMKEPERNNVLAVLLRSVARRIRQY